MSTQTTNNVEHELQLLEALANEPETTQADLAARVGVAVGTVNWYLKRWSKKGYIKIRRIDRWQWSYLLTPEGVARKTRLASEYIEASLSLYRRTRTEARRLLTELRAAGHTQVVIESEGEIAEICRLTCLEMGIESLSNVANQLLPTIQIDHTQLTMTWPGQKPLATDATITR